MGEGWLSRTFNLYASPLDEPLQKIKVTSIHEAPEVNDAVDAFQYASTASGSTWKDIIEAFEKINDQYLAFKKGEQQNVAFSDKEWSEMLSTARGVQ